MKFAHRRSLIDSSGIRRIFDLAATLKDPVNLSIGLPDFDVPEIVKGACVAAIQGGKNRYTQTAGTQALKRAVMDKYAGKTNPGDEVIITSGTTGGLYLCMLALLDPGDGVMFADPYFVMYKHLARFIGAEPIPFNTYPDFRPTREALETAWKPNAKLLVVNSPNNPTGIVYTPEECRLLSDFAREKGMILLSDEIYDALVFDGPFPSPAKGHPDSIIVSGLSKTVAMTGWRIGWVIGPADLIKALTEIQQYTFVCAPSIAQEAALEGLRFDPSSIVEAYRHKRDTIYNGLVEAGYSLARPGGAFYAFPQAPDMDGDGWVTAGIQHNLLTVPGSVFSERKTHFRISFAAPQEKLEAGLKILETLKKERPSK